MGVCGLRRPVRQRILRRCGPTPQSGRRRASALARPSFDLRPLRASGAAIVRTTYANPSSPPIVANDKEIAMPPLVPLTGVPFAALLWGQCHYEIGAPAPEASGFRF